MRSHEASGPTPDGKENRENARQIPGPRLDRNITVESRRPRVKVFRMRWRPVVIIVLLLVAAFESQGAGPVRLVKVLPHFIDKQGRIALSPSLYERDAYQAHLRKTPAEQGGMRFDVQWKSSSTNRFTLRLELRGNKGNSGTSLTLEEQVRYTGFLNTWSRIHLRGETYARLGELSAWRATMWDGESLVAEQKSFLW